MTELYLNYFYAEAHTKYPSRQIFGIVVQWMLTAEHFPHTSNKYTGSFSN